MIDDASFVGTGLSQNESVLLFERRFNIISTL